MPVIWNDRKHWKLSFGLFCVERWCEGARCDLHGYRGRHPVRVYRGA